MHGRRNGAGGSAGGCLHHLFEAQAERTPEAEAVVFGRERLTYREVARRAGRLAGLLRERGVGPEVRVGICLERSAEAVVAILGVLKAGGAYVPLDPAHPPARLELVLRDSGVRLVLAGPETRGLLPAHGVDVIPVEGGGAEPSGPPPPLPASGVRPENLAYVIYTSGSTGTPKGVMVPHGGVCGVIADAVESLGVRPGDRVLHAASLGFDASVLELFVALSAGAALHPVPRDTLLSPHRLTPLLREEGITHLVATPSLLELVDPGDLPAVRAAMVGGDRCPAGTARRWAGGRRLVNAYAPTEASIYCTRHVCETGADEPPPIGRAVAGARTHLLDGQMDPLPPGTPGELYLGGPGVVRGYLGRPELTAERFVPDPFSAEPGARLYRSGDLARERPDGALEFLGRADQQVKVRGFRIELGEVESVLQAHPGVADAAVVLHPTPSGEPGLCAHYAAEGAGPSAGELREWLGARLPEYMVPTAFVRLDALPRTSNGKVDREALPAPAGAPGEEAYVPPGDGVERVLAEVWAEVLGVARVGLRDRFFDLGGHSLHAARIIARVRDATGVEISMRELFEAPTVGGMAEAVEARLRSVPEREVPPLAPAPREEPIPLSLSQEAIWFFQELSAGMRSYNAQGAIRFRGTLDVDALERALTEIVRRHEIFRTTFPAVDGRPRQVVHDPWRVRIPAVELRGLDRRARDEEVRRAQRAAFLHPFDLERLPLVRFTLLRVADEEWVLVPVEHHFVHDGWSFGVLLRELTTLYTAFVRGEPSPLPPLPVQFADFALWQRRWLAGEESDAQLAFWKHRLTGAPPVLELPTDRPRPPAITFRGASHRVRLPRALAEEARAFGRRSGASLYMTLLTAFEALLHRYSGEEDVVVGSAVADRRWRETEELIGMIVNTVALRVDLSGEPTFRGVLGRVRERALEAYAHQDVHFGQVVEAVRPERSLSHLPIYQVAFSFHHAPYPELRLPGVEVEVTEALSNESAKFDLQVIVIPRGEQSAAGDAGDVTMVWEYSTDLFEAATIERMTAHYRLLLEAFLEEPDRRITAPSLLAPEERERVLAAGAGPVAARGGPRTVHEWVAARAAERPHAPAVVRGEEALTYEELERRANRLAHHLRDHGVGPETRVGVCLERGAELVVALLAVLKAGGAYLPLEPDHPGARLAWLLRDAGAAVLLTRTGLAERIPAPGVRPVCLDAEGEELSGYPDTPPESGVDAEGLAYVVHTSGSTGEPKGVAVTHGGLLNLAGWHLDAFGVTADDRTTLLAGVGFDAFGWELWPALASGASVHVPPEEVRTAPERLRDWLVETRATLSFLPTPLAEAVLALEWPAETALRTLLTGGDALRTHPRPELPFALVNAYGPTECTVVATSGTVPVGEGSGRAPSIGRPIAGARAYVLDAGEEPVPPGVPGELYVGGAGVARGYPGRPGLTAERWLPEPFGGAGERLYRTGDRVRWLASGELEFLGRVDRQVKVRGFRIEPGEVEAALLLHPAVAEAVVVAREEGAGDRFLAAYAVPAGEAPGVEALRAHLRERLPEHLVPATFTLLDALPLTPSGKVDRRALPAPERTAPRAEHVPPRTPLEEALAAIWTEVLGVERVGVHDHFFHVGGHSLRATRVISRIRDTLGVALPLHALFTSPTLAGLAEVVAARQVEESGEEALLEALRQLEGMSEEDAVRALGGGGPA